MNIKKIIREEVNDFEWIDDIVPDWSNVDTSEDYIEAWDAMMRPFVLKGITNLQGYVRSSDYDGTIQVNVTDGEDVDIGIYMETRYDEDTDVTSIVYTIQAFKPRAIWSGDYVYTRGMFDGVNKQVSNMLDYLETRNNNPLPF